MSNECCPEQPAAPVPQSPPVEWCGLTRSYRFSDGRVTEAPRSNPVPDGVYSNAVIRVEGGCIAEITSGENVLYSACDPCATPAPTPETALPPIDGDSCNITVVSSGALLTRLYTNNTDCIALIGCGTFNSPLMASPVLSPDAGNALECRANGLFVPDAVGCPGGVNYVGCGITITGGCVTQLPLPFEPVLSLYNDDLTMTIDRDVDNPCRVRLRALPVDTVTLEASARAEMYDTVGDLPPTTTGNGLAVVGTVNPRDVYLFVNTVGWRQLSGVTLNV